MDRRNASFMKEKTIDTLLDSILNSIEREVSINSAFQVTFKFDNEITEENIQILSTKLRALKYNVVYASKEPHDNQLLTPSQFKPGGKINRNLIIDWH